MLQKIGLEGTQQYRSAAHKTLYLEVSFRQGNLRYHKYCFKTKIIKWTQYLIGCLRISCPPNSRLQNHFH